MRSLALSLLVLVLAGICGAVLVLLMRQDQAPADAAPIEPGHPALGVQESGPPQAGRREPQVAAPDELPGPEAVPSRPAEPDQAIVEPPKVPSGERALIPEHEPYEAMSLADLEAFRQRLDAVLYDQGMPEHLARLQSGLGEYVPGDTVTVGDEVNQVLTAFHGTPSGYFKTTLPRAEYPQLYALKDEMNLIQDLVQQRKAAKGGE